MKLTPKQEGEVIEQFEKGVKTVDKASLLQTADMGKDKIEALDSNPPNALIELWEDIKLMISVLRDYISGDYRKMPWPTIAAIAGAVTYFVCPIDGIYDYIPLFGFIDDAAIITFALSVVHKDLAQYKEWKKV